VSEYKKYINNLDWEAYRKYREGNNNAACRGTLEDRLWELKVGATGLGSYPRRAFGRDCVKSYGSGTRVSRVFAYGVERLDGNRLGKIDRKRSWSELRPYPGIFRERQRKISKWSLYLITYVTTVDTTNKVRISSIN
jgi:hypothetical protein